MSRVTAFALLVLLSNTGCFTVSLYDHTISPTTVKKGERRATLLAVERCQVAVDNEGKPSFAAKVRASDGIVYSYGGTIARVTSDMNFTPPEGEPAFPAAPRPFLVCKEAGVSELEVGIPVHDVDAEGRIVEPARPLARDEATTSVLASFWPQGVRILVPPANGRNVDVAGKIDTSADVPGNVALVAPEREVGICGR